VVNVGQLADLESGTRVTLALREERGILTSCHGRLKVLGGGELAVPLAVTAAKFSETAQEKIVKAGGTVEVG
jgi:large subunit ribosomal protein L15